MKKLEKLQTLWALPLDPFAFGSAGFTPRPQFSNPYGFVSRPQSSNLYSFAKKDPRKKVFPCPP